ncbi:hypothetical protein GOP47_0026796 [Adiantum capillus-veneris]|nr:hypothetical protein GOP47_0026796 [Adiantum capillus-veneris]
MVENLQTSQEGKKSLRCLVGASMAIHAVSNCVLDRKAHLFGTICAAFGAGPASVFMCTGGVSCGGHRQLAPSPPQCKVLISCLCLRPPLKRSCPRCGSRPSLPRLSRALP